MFVENDKNIEKIVSDAASNVACENGDLSQGDLKKIKEQLMGLSNKSDDSFIFGLVKTLNKEEENGRKTK